MTSRLTFGLAAGVALAALAAGANAQSLSSNSSSFNAGWGRSSTSANSLDPNRFARDENGNRVIIDGVIQTGQDQSFFSRTDADGASSLGSGGAMAIGNNLTVITQGNWNTVIVDSTQINNGDVTANTNVVTTGQNNGG
jgi:holdfast attachment protein HfaA